MSRIDGQPNEKQVGDKGIDGVAWFYLDRNTLGRVMISGEGRLHTLACSSRGTCSAWWPHRKPRWECS